MAEATYGRSGGVELHRVLGAIVPVRGISILLLTAASLGLAYLGRPRRSWSSRSLAEPVAKGLASPGEETLHRDGISHPRLGADDHHPIPLL